MKTYYGVVSRFYPFDPHAWAYFHDEVEAEEMPQKVRRSGTVSDIFLDWFDSRDEAAKYVREIRELGRLTAQAVAARRKYQRIIEEVGGMSNAYREMRIRQQKEFDAFPLVAAFNNEQFEEMMSKWGLKPSDTDKIIRLYGGTFIRKSDKTAFIELTQRFRKEEADAIAADETGEGFIKDMFYYELCNHEYSYTMDPADALEALGYNFNMINGDERLKRGYLLAEQEARKVGWD